MRLCYSWSAVTRHEHIRCRECWGYGHLLRNEKRAGWLESMDSESLAAFPIAQKQLQCCYSIAVVFDMNLSLNSSTAWTFSASRSPYLGHMWWDDILLHLISRCSSERHAQAQVRKFRLPGLLQLIIISRIINVFPY